MIWEIYQQRRIGQVEDVARDARNQSNRIYERIVACEDKIDSLALACQAMWELLAKSESDPLSALSAKMQEIDARDGKIDGKMSRIMRECSECGRPLHARHRRCMYCGKEAPVENVFQS